MGAISNRVRQLLADLGDERSGELIRTALEMPDRLDDVLDGGRGTLAITESVPGGGPAPAEPSAMFLQSLTVEGFRGVGTAVTLDLPLGPGLTLVVGSNGSGKSSFAEGLEVLLTGDSYRFRKQNSTWKQGFRNAHFPHPTSVSADMASSGQKQPLSVGRTWEEGGSVEESSFTAKGIGVRASDGIEELGWSTPLELYRPFMSHEELSRVLDDKKIDTFRRVASILGLGDLTDATETLRQKRLELEKAGKQARTESKELIARLDADGGELAMASKACLGSKWDLERLEELLTAGPLGAESDVQAFRAMSVVEVPSRDRISPLFDDIRAAASGLDSLSGTGAEADLQTARLLEGALAHHSDHGDEPCPVCGKGALNEAWKEEASAKVAEINQRVAAYRQATKAVEDASERLAELILAVPEVFADRGDLVANAADVVAAWSRWYDCRTKSGSPLVEAVELAIDPLNLAVEGAVEIARSELDKRQAQWRPLKLALDQWLVGARQAAHAKADIDDLSRAESALKEITAAIRTERFAPLKEQTKHYWGLLRHESSVEIDDLALEGSANRGELKISASVDGTPREALAVMSQGELNCLSLSLFLPRATHPDSPFKFVMIDDPVQAMDPAKVDGLARVLAEVSDQRQVIVFTHDTRLREAVTRLQIEATVLEVKRRPQSQVALRPVIGPVAQHFKDARAVANDSDLDPAVARRVVPGLCTQGIESACVERIRRVRLSKGEPHEQVGLLIEDCLTLNQKMSMALFETKERGGDVLTRINSAWGRQYGDAFMACKKGGHGAFEGNLLTLVGDALGLAERVRRQ